MMTYTISSREFNQNTGEAKNNSKKSPVIITDRGKPTHVLMSYADYEKLTHPTQNIIDLLAMPEIEDIDFNPVKLQKITRPVDLD